MIKAVFNIEAPRDQVFSVFVDYPSYKSWIPGCEASTVTAANGATTDTEITVQSMKKMTLALRFEAVPTQLLSFRLISAKDIKAYAGSYRLMDSADGQGTVVIAELEIDAGPMAPKFLVDRMVKKTLDDTGTSLKKYVKDMPARAPSAAAPAAASAPRAAAAPAKKKRTRRVLRVTKTAEGNRIWYAGQEFTSKA